jgi:hypothetical protein
MFDEEDFETMGEDVMGDFATVGAAWQTTDAYGRVKRAGGVPAGVAPRLRAAPHRMASYGMGQPTPAMMPPRPAWRNRIAPGVGYPGQGLQPLPMTPSVNAGIFNLANQAITFTARPQVPFRTERMLASVRRTGAAGVLILAQTLFVGRQLQMVQQGNFDIEFFSPTAFGVRMSLDSAEPGVEITMNCIANPAIAGADTIAVSILLLGRSIR